MADIPSPNTNLRHRREALKAYRKARTEPSWVKIAPDIDFSDFVGFGVFGPVYCLLSDDSLKFVQPECRYRGRERREWTLEDLKFPPKAFAYDHSQQLLMLVERTSPYATTIADCIDYLPNNSRTGLVWRLHLLCSNTGNPHPLSMKPFLEFSCDQEGISPQWHNFVEIRQYAAMVLVFFRIVHEVSMLWVWNWKTGTLLYVSLVPLVPPLVY